MPRIAIPLILFSLLSCDLALAGPKQSKSAYTWSGPVQGTLWLRNLNGAITVESGTGAHVEVTAEVRWKSSQPSKARVVRRDGKAGTTFCGLFPAKRQVCGAGGQYDHDGVEKSDLELHFRVRVPKGLTIDIRTTNGSVQVEAETETLLVRTTNGSIRARASGPTRITGTNGGIEVTDVGSDLEVETTNGAIHVDFGGRSPRGKIELSTTNGAISTAGTATLSARVSASTVNGGIEVGGRRYRRRADVKLGTGAVRLAANTVNGSITIGR